MTYSVLLLYPNFVADEYGKETYYTYVEADTPQEAVDKARYRCFEDNGYFLTDYDPNDWHLQLLLAGEQADLCHEAQDETPYNPYEHTSSSSGCSEECEACHWEREHLPCDTKADEGTAPHAYGCGSKGHRYSRPWWSWSWRSTQVSMPPPC